MGGANVQAGATLAAVPRLRLGPWPLLPHQSGGCRARPAGIGTRRSVHASRSGRPRPHSGGWSSRVHSASCRSFSAPARLRQRPPGRAPPARSSSWLGPCRRIGASVPGQSARAGLAAVPWIEPDGLGLRGRGPEGWASEGFGRAPGRRGMGCACAEVEARSASVRALLLPACARAAPELEPSAELEHPARSERPDDRRYAFGSRARSRLVASLSSSSVVGSITTR